jgi:hypothetical protein
MAVKKKDLGAPAEKYGVEVVLEVLIALPSHTSEA